MGWIPERGVEHQVGGPDDEVEGGLPKRAEMVKQ